MLMLDYEIVMVQGRVVVSAQCPVGKTVLGCGLKPNSGKGPEAFRTMRIQNLDNCVCYDYYGTTCYAVCGKFTTGKVRIWDRFWAIFHTINIFKLTQFIV